MTNLKLLFKLFGVLFKLIICFLGLLVSIPFTMFLTVEQKAYFALQSQSLFLNLAEEMKTIQIKIKQSIKKDDKN